MVTLDHSRYRVLSLTATSFEDPPSPAGVILQYNLNVFCRSVYLTLICRRSQRFSGTRFLKRGGNAKVGERCLVGGGMRRE